MYLIGGGCLAQCYLLLRCSCLVHVIFKGTKAIWLGSRRSPRGEEDRASERLEHSGTELDSERSSPHFLMALSPHNLIEWTPERPPRAEITDLASAPRLETEGAPPSSRPTASTALSSSPPMERDGEGSRLGHGQIGHTEDECEGIQGAVSHSLLPTPSRGEGEDLEELKIWLEGELEGPSTAETQAFFPPLPPATLSDSLHGLVKMVRKRQWPSSGGKAQGDDEGIDRGNKRKKKVEDEVNENHLHSRQKRKRNDLPELPAGPEGVDTGARSRWKPGHASRAAAILAKDNTKWKKSIKNLRTADVLLGELLQEGEGCG